MMREQLKAGRRESVDQGTRHVLQARRSLRDLLCLVTLLQQPFEKVLRLRGVIRDLRQAETAVEFYKWLLHALLIDPLGLGRAPDLHPGNSHRMAAVLADNDARGVITLVRIVEAGDETPAGLIAVHRPVVFQCRLDVLDPKRVALARRPLVSPDPGVNKRRKMSSLLLQLTLADPVCHRAVKAREVPIRVCAARLADSPSP